MAHYQSKCDKLRDSTPTQKFIDLIFNLVQAMSSRIPRDALYAKDDCRNKQVRIIKKWNKIIKSCNFVGLIEKWLIEKALTQQSR